MHFKKTFALVAALALAVPTSVAFASSAQAAKGISVEVPPKPTKQDKPYKASAKEKSAAKGSPTGFSTFACPCFNYAVARQTLPSGATGAGIAANLPVENTFLKTNTPYEYHTLAQLHVQSPGNESIEFGVTVDDAVFPDTQPRLFAGYRKNGVFQGYGVGFVDYAANTTNTYGTAVAVTPGTQKRFEVRYSGGNWWLGYDLAWIGYFPGSLFTSPDTFTSGNLFQAFLEVAAPNVQSCSDMGNGLPVSNTSASKIDGINLTGLVPSTTAISFTGAVEPSTAIGYGMTSTGTNAWRAGGPGANAALTAVGTTGSC
jgi:hypothetical protein